MTADLLSVIWRYVLRKALTLGIRQGSALVCESQKLKMVREFKIRLNPLILDLAPGGGGRLKLRIFIRKNE